MLDFYIIDDHQPTPNDPTEMGLEFVGKLDDGTFKNLQKKNIIDKNFDFYSDFRLTTVVIKQIKNNILQKHLQTDTDVQKLINILNTAIEKQSGLIAYCD
ncbi:hypothetical protein [Sphingobacterium detergens]|uniref:Uncharacterized protein n=1 Tax=Sphingobacterium detergens TaxID=1145106 RepID=A0A420BKQ6_SPHD1|nr:hypothetical protein [Sphingobacterium detergens]RKE57292.1 hypothetical protein DFQ12_2179 [Sphingobacterium detergens]